MTVRALFDELVDLAPEDRAVYLHRHCDDEARRLEVMQLLRSHDQLEPTFLQPIRWLGGLSPRDSVGATAGPYTLVKPLARGGMSTVYLGRRDDGRYDSDVAIKVLELGSGITATQIEHERRSLASLQHPNITKLLDAGELPGGEPYLVMELVDGKRLDEYCRDKALTPREVVRIFLQVCGAVEAAHRSAILHRDLKPSNILVTAAGDVKLLDFGLARPLRRASTTTVGMRWMTPAYASPEQVRGESLTTSSDVYSLGVVLWEAVTGGLPYRTERHDAFALTQAITNGELRSVRDLEPLLGPDLAAVLAMAVHHDRHRRYQSVEQLREDLVRVLESRPVAARPDTLGYRARRFVQRQALPVSLATIAVLAVAVAVILTIANGRAAARQAAATRRLLYAAEMRFAVQAFEAGSVSIMQSLLARNEPRKGEEDIRGIEWYLLRNLEPDASVVLPMTSVVNGVAWSPDERWVGTAANDGGIALWNPATGEREALLGTHDGKAWAVAFSGDGQWLASVASDGLLRMWRTDDRRLALEVRAHQSAARAVAFSPDSGTIVTGGDDGLVTVRDIATPNEVRMLSTGAAFIRSVDVSPDGRLIAAAADGGRALVWSRQRTLPDHVFQASAQHITGVRFTPSSRELVSSSLGGSILLWNLETGRLRESDHVNEGMMEAVAVARDGELVLGGHGPWVTWWRTRDWEPQHRKAAHDGRVTAMALSPTSGRLVTAGSDSRVKFWDLDKAATLPSLVGHRDGAWSVRFSTDGQQLASASNDGTVRLWDAETGALLRTLDTGPLSAKGVAFADSNRTIFSAPRGGRVVGWRTSTGEQIAEFSYHTGQVYEVAVSPDGSLLVAGGEDGTASICDIESGRRLFALTHESRVRGVAFSTDGTLVGTASEDGTAGIWRVSDGRRLATLRAHGESVYSVSFSPDGQTIATSGTDRTIRFWDARTFVETQVLTGHGDRVWSVAFSPDGRRVASASNDATVRIWDVDTGRELVALKGPMTWRSVTFSPDGEKLAASNASGGISLWLAPRNGR